VTLTTAQLTAWLGTYLWPLFRIAALVAAAPVTGSRSVPMRARLALAVAITIVVAPMLPPVPAVDPFSFAAVMIIIQQVLIGTAMGFALQLVFEAIITGGQVVAMQTGLGFASMVDPQNGVQVPVVSQFYLLAVTLLFLGLNGHLLLIRILVDSFKTVPIAPAGITRDGLWTLVSFGTQMFAGAVWLALPVTASLLMVNLAFGVMARAAPQLNIFSIGFPITMLLGFLAIYYLFPTVVPQFSSMMNDGFTLVHKLIVGGGP